jgi:hypothetical protein
MSVITFPSTLKAATMTWGQRRNDMEYRSIFGAQAVEGSGALWEVSLIAPPDDEANVGAWKALLMQLRGRTNQLAIWDKNRPVPIGTMRGTMTLNTAIAQGDVSTNIVAAGQNGLTLVAGDLIGAGSGLTQQVVMVTALSTSNGSGIITFTNEPPWRNAITIGSAVTWNQPQVLFRRQDSKSAWNYTPGQITDGFSLNLLEDPRP